MGIFNQLRALFRSEPEPLSVQPRSMTQERRTRERVDAREGTRVLIIDDSKTVVMAIKKFLRSAGYETFEAFDAETGLGMILEILRNLSFLTSCCPA